MYAQALKQREYYIENFGLHRFKMLDYYKILACIAWFWFDEVEPVVCGECGCLAVMFDNEGYYTMHCAGCNNTSAHVQSYDRTARTKKEAIKRWNKMNYGTFNEIRKD
jgi:hypothetical protein